MVDTQVVPELHLNKLPEPSPLRQRSPCEPVRLPFGVVPAPTQIVTVVPAELVIENILE